MGEALLSVEHASFSGECAKKKVDQIGRSGAQSHRFSAARCLQRVNVDSSGPYRDGADMTGL